MSIQSAVLVIDMANDFIHPGGVIADAGGAEYQARARGIIPALRRLLDAAREAGVRVIYATDAHLPGDTELRKWPPHAMKGTPQAEIVKELAPVEGDVVLEKQTYSPFASTDLEAILEREGITRLYVTGLHTDCCARHASGDAFQKGFDLVWVTDALQAFTDEAHQAGLEYFKAWYATDPDRQLRTSAQVIADWAAVGVGAE
ncbi:MAG TPA: isochorismatase family cysteine hydrolase [Gemmatimonadales bacterium]|nr:isochorismatase family cysteine hydrolase [Gemmatimonadales bacterium]